MSALSQEINQIKQVLARKSGYALTGVAVVAAPPLFFMSPTQAAIFVALAFTLALLTVIDLQTHTIPHVLNGLVTFFGLMIAFLTHTNPLLAIASGLLLGALFLLMGLITTRYTGEAALGGGDVYLTAALGISLGISGIPPFLLVVALLGIAVVAYRRNRPHARRFAFGPVLALAGWLTLIYQEYYWKCIAFLTA